MTKGFKKSWRLVFITMIIIILFSLIGSMPVFRRRSYIFTILGELAILLPVWIGLKHIRKKEEIKDIFLNGFSPVLIPVLVVLPFTMQTFITYLTLPYHAFLRELIGEYENNIVGANNIKSFIVQLVSICIVPAVVEEFLCRGVIMKFLRSYGVVVMLVGSSVAFAMMHFNLYAFLVIFMLGMLLGVVRLVTGSLWASVIMHFSNNLMTILSLMIPKEMEMRVFGVSTIASLVIFPIAFGILVKKTSGIKIERMNKKIEFSYEMILCILMFCAIAGASIYIL